MKVELIVLILQVYAFYDVLAQSLGRCYTRDQHQGQCIQLDQCSALHDIIKKGLDKATRDEKITLSLAHQQCGYFDGKLLVCCKQVASSSTPTPPPPTPSPTPQRTDSQCTGFNLLPKPGHCGEDLVEKIFGGNETKLDEHPWTVLLQYSRPGNRKGFYCGGVLINSRYVLTAAHCILKISKFTKVTHVRLGEWNIENERDCETSFGETFCSDPPVDVPVEEIITHENYEAQNNNQHNDIALLRLSRNVEFTQFISPICLPLDEKSRSDLLVKKTLNVAGWGQTETRSQSQVKLKVDVDGVSNEKCQETYGTERRQIVDSQICAGGVKGFDSCRGDSGGPLMRQNHLINPPYWYLAGLVSYGPSPCGQEGWPGVYTRVANYIDWICENVKP